MKKKYSKGDFVYKVGEPSKKLVIIRKGTFEQYSQDTTAHLTDTGLKRKGESILTYRLREFRF